MSYDPLIVVAYCALSLYITFCTFDSITANTNLKAFT